VDKGPCGPWSGLVEQYIVLICKMFLKPIQSFAHGLAILQQLSAFDHIIDSHGVPGQLAGLAAVWVADTGRAHPIESLETLGGPTQKKKQKILIRVVPIIRGAVLN